MTTIAFTANWHVGITHSARIEELLKKITQSQPDVVIIVGDHGTCINRSRKVLSLARAMLACPIGLIAGNHDLWCETGGQDG